MKYNKVEIPDFECSLCASSWLKYFVNKNPCGYSFLGDGRHNFDFGRPINVDSQESEACRSGDKVKYGRIMFQ